MTFASEHSSNRNYTFTKTSSDGLWGVHTPQRQDNWNPAQAAQQRAAQQAEREQRQQEWQEELANGLPLGRRSSEFRQFGCTLKLDPRHRQNLRDRGLTDEQINLGLFRSITSGQRVKAHPSLPGVKSAGFGDGQIWFGQKGDRGILCPAFNHHGQITGAQVRRDSNDDGRYRWLKGKFTSHLQSGELPITTVVPKHPQGIMLAEGILKPYIAAHRHGYVAIGAAGGNFCGSPEQLKAELQALTKQLDTREILFAADAGSRKNQHVWQRDSKTIQLIQSWGYTVKIGDWGQRDTKDALDIDELENLDNVQWVDPDFAPEPENTTDSAPKSNKPQTLGAIITWVQGLEGKLPQWIKSLDHLTGTAFKWAQELGADRTFLKRLKSAIAQFKQQYRTHLNTALSASQVMPLSDAPVGTFGEIALPENERRLYLLNGQKGTGKTSGAIKETIKTAKLAGLRILMVVPTRFLSRDSANRLGMICHLDEVAASRSRYVVTCPESVQKFSHQPWDIVIIDEVNEVAPRSWLGNLGNTPKQSRQALTDAVASARYVILAQDGLHKPVVQAFQRLGNFTEAQTEIIQRRRTPHPMTVHLYLSRRQEESWDGAESDKTGATDQAFYGWLQGIKDTVEQGKRIAIPSGSRSKARQLYRYLRKQYPHRKVAIVDGKDSFSSLRNAIAQNFDQWLNDNQPDIIIWTPVFNSGVSIESDYFDAQFEYVSAFETATSASQRGERVRAVLGGGKIQDRHVFIQQRGLPTDVPEEVLTPRYWLDTFQGAAKLGLKESLEALTKLGMADLSKAVKEAATAPVDEYPELAELLAIQAREIHFKAEDLQSEWSGNGWTIISGKPADKDVSTQLAIDMGWIKEGIIDVQSRTYAKAPSQFRENHKQCKYGQWEGSISAWESGEEPQGPIEAAHFHRWTMERLVGDQPWLSDPDWWAAFDITDKQAIRKLRLRAMVMMSESIFSTLQWWAQLATIGKAVEEGPTLPSLPVTYRELETAALLRNTPGIHDVLTGELQTWSKHHPTVKATKDWAVEHAKQLAACSRHDQLWHGYQFTPNTPPVKAFHKLLKMVGLETTCRWIPSSGRSYQLKVAEDVAVVADKLDPRDNSYELKLQRLKREHYRVQMDQFTFEAIAAHLCNQEQRLQQQWQDFEESLKTQTQPEHSHADLQKEITSTLSEVLRSPESPPSSGIPQSTLYRPGDRVWAWFENQWHEATILKESFSHRGWILETFFGVFPDECLHPVVI